MDNRVTRSWRRTAAPPLSRAWNGSLRLLEYAMSRVVNFLSARFPDFGRGYGLALFFGVPVWALFVASRKQDFFAFASARDVISIILWLTGLFALTSIVGLTKLRIKKVGKEGVEFDYAAEAIPPKVAMEKAAPPTGGEAK